MMPAAGELSAAWLLAGCAAAAAISAASVRTRLLTVDGGIVQFVLGWLLAGLGGLPWVLPIAAFFLSSSTLSRWSAARRPEAHRMFSKGAVRDGWQVLANGGLAGVLVVIAFVDPRPVWFAAYAGVCAAAAADTWGTEIGVMSRRDPRLLPSLKPVPAGTSGAVSLPGTVGSVLGAALISAVSFCVPSYAESGTVMLSGFCGGLAGPLADSLVGALFQARFRCRSCGSVTERSSHCGTSAAMQGGVRWISNDVVNLACTLTGAGVAGLTSVLLG